MGGRPPPPPDDAPAPVQCGRAARPASPCWSNASPATFCPPRRCSGLSRPPSSRSAPCLPAPSAPSAPANCGRSVACSTSLLPPVALLFSPLCRPAFLPRSPPPGPPPRSTPAASRRPPDRSWPPLRLIFGGPPPVPLHWPSLAPSCAEPSRPLCTSSRRCSRDALRPARAGAAASPAAHFRLDPRRRRSPSAARRLRPLLGPALAPSPARRLVLMGVWLFLFLSSGPFPF